LLEATKLLQCKRPPAMGLGESNIDIQGTLERGKRALRIRYNEAQIATSEPRFFKIGLLGKRSVEYRTRLIEAAKIAQSGAFVGKHPDIDGIVPQGRIESCQRLARAPQFIQKIATQKQSLEIVGSLLQKLFTQNKRLGRPP